MTPSPDAEELAGDVVVLRRHDADEQPPADDVQHATMTTAMPTTLRRSSRLSRASSGRRSGVESLVGVRVTVTNPR